MTLPNFLILGAAKSGTTSFMRYLMQHPQVFMCPIKTQFFYLGEDPAQIRNTEDGWYHRASIKKNLADYQAQFDSVGSEKAIGETCDTYLSSQRAAQRIQQYIPMAKLIAILRNPVDRAFSSFAHMLRDGYETLEFAEALIKEQIRVAEGCAPIWQYRQRGYYYNQIKTYIDLFGKEQLKVFLYDDMHSDINKMLRQAFEFLSVDPNQQIDTSMRYNVSGAPRNKAVRAIHDSLTKPNRTKTLIKTIVPRKIIRSVSRSILHRFQMHAFEKPQMPAELRQSLTEDYREDILKLQDLIDRDLSEWIV